MGKNREKRRKIVDGEIHDIFDFARNKEAFFKGGWSREKNFDLKRKRSEGG